MNKPRKRYSVSGTFDTLSSKDPSHMQSLKKLNANILNYIKTKGIKYHDLSNKSFDKDPENEDNKRKITTIKEENEEIDQKTNFKTYSPSHKRNLKSSILNEFEKKKRSNSLKLIRKIKFNDKLLNSSGDKNIELETEFSDENNISINSYIHKENIDKNNKKKYERKKSSDDIINENKRKLIPINLLKTES